MKKQHEERLEALESRRGDERSSAVDGDELRQQVRDDVKATLERRLTQLREDVRQQTDDRCRQLEKVRTLPQFIYGLWFVRTRRPRAGLPPSLVW